MLRPVVEYSTVLRNRAGPSFTDSAHASEYSFRFWKRAAMVMNWPVFYAVAAALHNVSIAQCAPLLFRSHVISGYALKLDHPHPRVQVP